MSIKYVQKQLKTAGYYEGDVDGLWGNQSVGALQALIDAAKGDDEPATIATYHLSQVSIDRLDKVHSDLQRIVNRAIELTGIDFRVNEGMRSITRQRELVNSGASQTMNSRHLSGHAVDLIALDANGDVSWDWALYYKIETAVKQAADDVGVSIEWGGDWRSFKDGMHWQLPWASYPK